MFFEVFWMFLDNLVLTSSWKTIANLVLDSLSKTSCCLSKTKHIVRSKSRALLDIVPKKHLKNEVNDRRLVLSVSFPAICSETREEQTHASNKHRQHQQVKFSLLREPWWKEGLELWSYHLVSCCFHTPNALNKHVQGFHCRGMASIMHHLGSHVSLT